MRTLRFALLASAGLVFATACSGDVVAPGGPTIAGSPTPSLSPLFTAVDTGGTEPDSVISDDCTVEGPLECLGNNPCGKAPDVACTTPDDPCIDPGYFCPDTTTAPPAPPPAPAPAPRPASPTPARTAP
jgi:hypothetical protein